MRALLTFVLLAATACEPVLHNQHKPDAGVDGYSFPDAMDPTGDGSVVPDGGVAYTPTTFLVQWEVKSCAAAFACKNNFPNNTGATFTQTFGQDQTQCKSIMATYDNAAVVEMDITAGKIHWNAPSGQTCITSFAYQCNNYWNNGPTFTGTSCSNTLVGTVSDNNFCTTDWECQSWTSYCDPN